MNVEENLQEAKFQLPAHAVDKEKFIQSFWAKLGEQEAPRTGRQKSRKLLMSTAALALVGGLTVSPMIASAVSKIPLVHVVLSWVHGTDAAPYVQSVQQSATDHGITMTITDVLYGPSQLSFGFITSASGNIPFGPPDGMEFFVNGKKVDLQGGSTEEATTYGSKGLVNLTDDGTATTLPTTFNFQILVHKIGNQSGTWKFTVPVSRENMTPNQSFLPMVTKQVGNETITVKEVQLYATGGMIDYDVTVPAGVKPSLNVALFAENKSLLDALSAKPSTATSHVKHGSFETWSYNQPFRLAGQTPTSLIIDPTILAGPMWRTVPVTGPFPVTMTSPVLGTRVITGASIKGNTVTVLYTSTMDPNMPGFGFSIEDTTHPDQSFGGAIGQKDDSSGPDAYKNVYQFSQDVSSDQLVLTLPPETPDYVFDVPLQLH